MRRIFLGFLLLLGITLYGCSSRKNIKEKSCSETASVMIIKQDGDSLSLRKHIILNGPELTLMMDTLVGDSAILYGFDGLTFLEGEYDSMTKKYKIIIKSDTADTIIIPIIEGLTGYRIENDKCILGKDTILIDKELLNGKNFPTFVIEGNKYIVGKDTFLMPRFEGDIVIMNGDTIKLDKLELEKGKCKSIKIIKKIDGDSTEVEVEIEGKELKPDEK